MQRIHHIPGVIFWPCSIAVLFCWIFLVAWVVLHFFGVADVGSNPLEAIPRMLQMTGT